MGADYRLNSTPSHSELLKGLDEIVEASIGFVSELRFNKRVFRHQVIVGLGLSIIERSHAVGLLVKNSKAYDAEIIFRSLLEHFVELKICVDTKEYEIHLQKPFLKDIERTLREAGSGNPFLASITEAMNVDQEREQLRKRIGVVEGQGGKELNTQAKFHAAKMKNEYESMFRSTSNQVHPCYSGIIKRHFAVDEVRDDFDVRLFAEAEEPTCEAVLNSTVEILTESLELLNKFARAIETY